MRKRAFFGALLAALLTLIVAASSASALPRSFFGIVPQTNPPADEFARMGQGKVGAYRWALSWAGVESTQGTYDWSGTDALMQQLALNNIEPVPFICCTPGFIHSDSGKPPTGPDEEAQYEAFLRAVVQRYGPDGDFWAANPSLDPKPIRYYQIFNEENSSTFFHPKPDPKVYAHLLHISSQTIKSEEPNAYILLGGMFGTPHPANGPATVAWKFLKQLYKQGAKKDFDAVAPHPYSPNLSGIKFQIQKLRKVMKQHHDKNADMWVTEIGWGSASHIPSFLGKGKKGQARILKKSFKLLKHKRKSWNIKGVMWFTWIDHEDPSFCDWCDTAGLFNKKFEPKPSWKQYVKFTGGKP
jgi:polysaccharide biosynthesis protein PslG